MLTVFDRSTIILLRLAVSGSSTSRLSIYLLLSIAGHLPLLEAQARTASFVPRGSAVRRLADLVYLDARIILLWHSICPAAMFLQQEPWTIIVRASIPFFLAICTRYMAQSNADLDLEIASLKAKKYGLQGA